MSSKREPTSSSRHCPREDWSRTTWRAAIYGALLIVAWYLLVPLLSGSNYYGLDLNRTDLGAICELKRWVSDHRAPGLSRFLGAGIPLFAEPQVGLLYPPRWIMAFLDIRWAIFFQVAFHLGLGAFATGLLIRRQATRPASVFIGVLAYGLSGTALNYVYHSVFILDLVWVPLFWVGLGSALQSSRRGPSHALAALVAAVSLLMLMLGGEPQGVIWCAGITVFETLVFIRRKLLNSSARAIAIKDSLRRLLPTASLILGSLLVSLLLWLPALEELRVSVRESGISALEAFVMTYGPGEWLASFLPGLLDNSVLPNTPIYQFFYLDVPGASVWNLTPYLGFLLVGLAAGASIRKKNRKFALMGGVAVLLALGNLTPIYPWLFAHLEWVTKFRYPAKQFALVNLCVVVLGVVGLDRLARARDRRLYAVALGLVTSFGLFGLVWLLRQDSRFDQTLFSVLPEMRPSGTGNPVSPSEYVQSCFLRGLLPAIAGLAVISNLRLTRAIVPLVLLLDFASLNFMTLPLSAEPYATEEATALRQLRAQEDSAHLEPIEQEIACAFPVLDTSGPRDEGTGTQLYGTTYRLQKTISTAQINACNGERVWPPYNVLTPRISPTLRRLQAIDQHLRWARASGCTTWITHVPLSENRSEGIAPRKIGYSLNGQRSVLYEYRISDPLPYIGVLQNPYWEANRDHFTTWVKTHERAPAVYQAVAPRPGVTKLAPLPTGLTVQLKSGTHPSPDRFEVELSGRGAAVVEFRQPFAMGWRATQNGQPLQTVRVLAQFLGVIVPNAEAGPIEVEYSIPRLGVGLIAAAVGLGLMLLGFFCLRPTCQRRLIRSK